MTSTLPRPIEPGEQLRKGSSVRATRRENLAGITASYEFVVDYEIDGRAYAANSGPHGATFDRDAHDWTLLAEAPTPTPAPAVGSRWASPDSFNEFVYTSEGRYLGYRGAYQSAVLDPNFETDRAVLAKLQRIPDHGDGCSEWLWDEETGTAWVAGSAGNRDATHIQVSGRKVRSGYLEDATDADFAARLRPYSERGQR